MSWLARYKWPILFALIGIALLVLAAISIFAAFRDTGMRFLAPGETTVAITQPGDYTLWHESRAFIDGRFMTFEDALPPDTTITVLEQPDGATVPLRRAGNTSVEAGGTRRVAVAKLTLDRPGDYRIVVTGLEEQRAFYLAEARFWKIFTRLVGFGLTGTLFLLAAIGSAIYILIRSNT